MIGKYGEAAYSAGYQVTTTIDSKLQTAAVSALRQELERLDREPAAGAAQAFISISAKIPMRKC